MNQLRVTNAADTVRAIEATQSDRADDASEALSITPSTLGLALTASAGAAWTAVVGGLAIWRHDQFLSHRYDLGNMVQAVWSTTQGRPLEMTDAVTGEQISRLAAHVDPILVLFAPLWWLHPGPESLLVGYVAVIAAGVYPVVRLSFKYTQSAMASALLGAWYLVLPWVVWIALNELNPVSLALPLLLFTIWFLDEGHLGRSAAAIALALATGELVGLTVAGIGVWYAIRTRRRAGLVVALAGTAWTFFCLVVVVPAFSDGEPSRYYQRYEHVGGSPRGLLETLLGDPGSIVAHMTTRADVVYMLLLVVSTGFLVVVQPLLLVAAAPQLGVNLLSDFPSTVSPVYHYSAPLLPALIGACIFAIGRLAGPVRVVAAGLPFAASLLLLAAFPPRPGTDTYLFVEVEPPLRLAAMREAVQLVPTAAPVTATNRLGAHLSARRRVHLFPSRGDAQWAVLDVRDRSSDAATIDRRRFESEIAQLERDRRWRLVLDQENVLVYRRLR